jgi:hypothetical protein
MKCSNMAAGIAVILPYSVARSLSEGSTLAYILCGVGTGLNKTDLYAELGELVVKAVRKRLDGELAGPIDAEEGEGHTAQNRPNVDEHVDPASLIQDAFDRTIS